AATHSRLRTSTSTNQRSHCGLSKPCGNRAATVLANSGVKPASTMRHHKYRRNGLLCALSRQLKASICKAIHSRMACISLTIGALTACAILLCSVGSSCAGGEGSAACSDDEDAAA